MDIEDTRQPAHSSSIATPHAPSTVSGALKKCLLLFLYGSSVASGFVPSSHHARPSALSIPPQSQHSQLQLNPAFLPAGKSTASRLFALVAIDEHDDDDDEEEKRKKKMQEELNKLNNIFTRKNINGENKPNAEYLANAESLRKIWKKSEEIAFSGIPRYEQIAQEEKEAWLKELDKYVYVELDDQFLKVLEQIKGDMLTLEEKPFIEYLQAYWKECSKATVSDDTCAKMTKELEPRTSLRLQQLNDVIGKRSKAIELQWKKSSSALEMVKEATLNMARQVNVGKQQKSDAELRTIADTLIDSMEKDLLAAKQNQLEKVIQVEHRLLARYVEALGKLAVDLDRNFRPFGGGKLTDNERKRIVQELEKWQREVQKRMITEFRDKSWKKQFDDVLDTEEFLRELKGQPPKEEDEAWQAKRVVDENMLKMEWLRRRKQKSTMHRFS